VGDSVTNRSRRSTPDLIIILAFTRRYRPNAGLGTLLSVMLPCTLVFSALWSALLGVWVLLGWPLGSGGGFGNG
jgi:aminobenzoyl-glutamate transport protein